MIASSEGARLPIVPGTVRGSVDESEVLDGVAQISGWAASPKNRRAADAILIFADDRYVGAVSPANRRPDVEGAQDLPEDDYGYLVQFPLSLVQAGQLHVFAAEGGVTSKLAFNCPGDAAKLGC